jgi:hypothetical protein
VDPSPPTSAGKRKATIAVCGLLFLYGLMQFTDGRVSPDDVLFAVPAMIVGGIGAIGAARNETWRWLKVGLALAVLHVVLVVGFVVYVFSTSRGWQS